MKTHTRDTKTRKGNTVTLCGRIGAKLAQLGEQPSCKKCMTIKGIRAVRGWPR